ncbi:glycosyltransferase family 39 protein [bacterium]|nr:glycosyltransferase family 39 protein [bacterium]
MIRNLNKFNKPFIILFVVYILLQIILVLSNEPHFESDSLYYYQKASQCVADNSLYPNESNIYDDFLVAPIYINYLFIILKVFNSAKAILFFNIILNSLNLVLVYSITKKIFSNSSAFIAAVLYVLYLNNFGIILMNLTDLLFCSTILLSIYFFLINKRLFLFLAGVMIAISIGIRPLGWALLLAMLIIIALNFKHFGLSKMSFLISGCLIIIIGQGIYNSRHFGDFIFTGTTGSLNLLIGANDDATGTFEASVFDKGKIGYLENPDSLTYIEKGEFYQNQAVNWIKSHPIRWISLLPAKFAYLFITDDYALYPLISNSQIHVYEYAKALFKQKDFASFIRQPNRTEYLILAIMHHLFYIFILLFFFYQFYVNFKQNRQNYNVLLIELFIIFGLLMTIPIYGSARYKYPYIVLGMIVSSPIIANLQFVKKFIYRFNKSS